MSMFILSNDGETQLPHQRIKTTTMKKNKRVINIYPGNEHRKTSELLNTRIPETCNMDFSNKYIL